MVQIDALSALAEQKTALYRALQRLSDERVLMFARLGAKVNDENIRIVLADLPEALTAWQEVVGLAAEAKERNPHQRPADHRTSAEQPAGTQRAAGGGRAPTNLRA